jgi:alkanesulfonate monooxygenase SsuD/methylene tetrahydromethanopterin reductase-like flavin-dependent oxidoreductase (luciferase family)
MRIGVVFPQTELGGDVAAVRAYAQRAEELGFTHVLAYDHVAGADPAVHTGWDGPYDVRTTFHEPMVLYGYLAAVSSMELVTGIIILPQRQTVLAAKQAAEVDLLTGGRFRLGVGIGWNRVEYEALGQDFSTRGQRLEEQITLLRRLWTEQTVTFSGTFDRIKGRLRWQEDRDKLAAAMHQWQDADATHLSVNTMGAGLKTVDDHLAALATAAEAVQTISGCVLRAAR